MTYLLKDATLGAIRRTSLALVTGFVIVQAVASLTFFPRYDLSKVAAFVEAHPASRFGFVGPYQGELNFLARRRDPMELVAIEHAAAWFDAHPGSFLIDFHDSADAMPGKAVLTTAYRGGLATIFQRSAVQ